jgi:uncharacterized membrane protein YfhO
MYYVKNRYGVPAKRGMKVIYDGEHEVIKSAKGGYIKVRFDELRFPKNIPPLELDYILPNGIKTFSNIYNARIMAFNKCLNSEIDES